MKRSFISAIILLLLLSNVASSKASIIRSILNTMMDSPTKELFKAYHLLMEKKYDLNTEEAIKKYSAFKENLKFIKEKNAKNLGYTLGLTPFADLTNEEYRNQYSSPIKIEEESPTKCSENNRFMNFDDYADKDNETTVKLPSTDWTYLYDGVRDQGNCPNSFAFSAAGALEGLVNIKTKTTVKFSSQQMIDCAQYNSKCHSGGNLLGAANYIGTSGLMYDSDYPYTANDTGNCKYDSKKSTKMTNFKMCYSKCCHENVAVSYLMDGPVASYVDNSSKEFQLYVDGVFTFTDKNCGFPNHSLMIVYADDTTLKLRNSFGDKWGKDGYMTVARDWNLRKTCWLESYALLPTTFR